MDRPLQIKLRNGLRVILLEKRDAPVVSWNLWANVGSANESDQTAGLCHLIEHMLFKGTSRRPVGQIAREVEAAGGDMNAYTSFDETVFYINMSSRNQEVGLDILADAVLDPTFDATELAREKEVVVEEINRAEDNPSQMVGEDLFRKLFQVHTYGRPIAGDRKTVREVPRETLMKFFRQWYVGKNLLFIGVGDFSAEATAKKIEALLEPLSSDPPPHQKIPTEPSQKEPRFISRGMKIEGHYLEIGFPATQIRAPETPALDLLGQILGGGLSSRFEQRVKEQKRLVSSISSSAYTPRDPGIFFISAVLKDGRLDKPLQAVWEEVDRISQERITPLELARARENIRSSRIYEKQTADRLARKLGFFAGVAGDLDFEEAYYGRIGSVTPEEIREVAEKYLKPERLTLSLCHPEGENWGKLPQLVQSLKKRISRPAPRERSSVQSFRLKSGLRLLVRENHSLPIVAIRGVSQAGLRVENKKNNGISHLYSLLVTKGTISRTAREVAEESENRSAHFDGYTGFNLTGLSSTFLSENLTEGIEIFTDLLLNPSFPEAEILKEKGITLTAIRNQEDSLSSIAMKHFLAKLYPYHPYGLPILGSPKTVRPLRRADLIQFHQKWIRPETMVLAISGDVDPQEMKERLEEKFFLVKKKSPVPSKWTANPPPSPQEITLRRKEKHQAHIVYGFLGSRVTSQDRYALEALNCVLAGQGGRLFLELRDKKGLAYAISSSNQEGVEPGYFMVYMGCDPTKLETAIEGIQLELGKIASEKVSEEELERAKRYIIGNYELDLQKNSSVAAILASEEIYGNGWEELHRYPEQIQRVTADQVLQVAKKYLRPKNSVLSIVRP